MSSPIIEAEGLGKCYQLGSIGAGSLRDELSERWARFLGREVVSRAEPFWALKDVSFRIDAGDVVGVIGRNGAGKSTLLKLLSRITEPTCGRAVMRGRVASLLEVGTGFHPDLTGRENIFLNGAILGMTRAEIRRKFDEIVGFAEVEKFIDTPVKRYSSGMYVRLAFAVAAHLEPEILIVDEVLAVGDTEFQKKCIGKMEQVAHGGRTVLFVSHNMSAVSAMTNKCLLLSKGRVLSYGPTKETVAAYFGQKELAAQGYTSPKSAGGEPHFVEVRVITSEPGGVQAARKPIEISFLVDHSEPLPQAYVTVRIMNSMQQPVVQFTLTQEEGAFCREANGLSRLSLRIPAVRLAPGQYTLSTWLGVRPGGRIAEQIDGLCGFEVLRLGEGAARDWEQDASLYTEDGTWSVSR